MSDQICHVRDNPSAAAFGFSRVSQTIATIAASLYEHLTTTPSLQVLGDGPVVLNVNWDATTRDASSATSPLSSPKQMRFDNLGGFSDSRSDPTGAFNKVNNTLCDTHPHPVIVGVKGVNSSCVPSGTFPAEGTPGHYVLITGKQVDAGGNAHYSIVDPGCASNTSLDVYNNEFATRGVVKDPPGDISQLDIAVNNSADVLVTDPSGNRTGHDLSAGTISQAIPGSAYFSDSLDNDVTGAVATEVGNSVEIFQPHHGTFRVSIVGTKLSTYSVSIAAYSQDGSQQPPIVLPGIEGPGSATLYEVQLTSSPGSVSTASVIATFSGTLADINYSLQLGLIDDPGVANSLSRKINAAQNATGATVTNILHAFINDVNAQTGKHVTTLGAQILLQDAGSLINQNRI